MAVLFHVSKQRARDTTELYTWLLNINIAVRHLDYVYKPLQVLHDDFLECLRAFVYTLVLELALLRRHISECSGKFLNLHHLYNLHLHCNTVEAVSVFDHGAGIFSSV